MRRKHHELLSEAHVVDGTAEAIPAEDASADAVVAAQAFHWFRARKHSRKCTACSNRAADWP